MSHTHFLGQAVGSELYVAHYVMTWQGRKNLALPGNMEMILLEMFTFPQRLPPCGSAWPGACDHLLVM